MKRLQRDYGSSILLITHDMGVVSEIAERVVVMYAGQRRRGGPEGAVFRDPQHPYTWGLLGSIPRVGRPRVRRLAGDPGLPPSLLAPPRGCRFAPRCTLPLRPLLRSRPELRRARRAGPRRRAAILDAGERAAGAASARRRRPHERRTAARGASTSSKHFPVQADGVPARRRTSCTRSTASRSRCGAARRSASSASRAAASRRSAGCSCACTSRRAGTVRFDGTDITSLSRRELRPFRREMQMIFQDPYASLNPRKRVGQILEDPFRIHRSRQRAADPRAACSELLEVVGLSRRSRQPLPARVLRRPAPADRRRARARAEPAADRRRRAGLGARRLDPGAGDQPARRPPGRVRPDLRLHRARPRRSSTTSPTGSR